MTFFYNIPSSEFIKHTMKCLSYDNLTSLLLDPPTDQHIALLYDSVEELNRQVGEYLNEGLRRGQLCVYATVHFRDEGHTEKFASLIADYKEHVENGDLLVVDLAPFYISALLGDIKPFEDAKKLFAEKAKERADKHVRFVGDGTGFLFKNKHFDECAMIEQWWQSKPFEGSYVCPYHSSFFENYPHEMHSNRAVIETHDAVLEISQDQEIAAPSQKGSLRSENMKGDGAIE